MTAEIPINNIEIASKTENEFENTKPIRMVRDALGALSMTWDKSDPDDPRPSQWETILRGLGDGKTLIATSHYVTVDSDRPAVWKEFSIPISPNKDRTSYQVIGSGQMNIPTKRIVELLQAVRRGVDLYTDFKELAPEQQKEITYIDDKFPSDYSEDEEWKKVTYTYGIRENPKNEVLSD